MTNAIYVGILLIVGGALLEGASGQEGFDPDESEPSGGALLGSYLSRRTPTRTTRLLQALGTVLLIIGLLAQILRRS